MDTWDDSDKIYLIDRFVPACKDAIMSIHNQMTMAVHGIDRRDECVLDTYIGMFLEELVLSYHTMGPVHDQDFYTDMVADLLYKTDTKINAYNDTVCGTYKRFVSLCHPTQQIYGWRWVINKEDHCTGHFSSVAIWLDHLESITQSVRKSLRIRGGSQRMELLLWQAEQTLEYIDFTRQAYE